jgi:hypothetical protein
MVMTILAMSLIMALAVVTVAAVNGDTHLTRNDLNRKQAYEAARAGVEDYAFHLTADNKYWEGCTEVPTPNAVNQQGAVAAGTAKTRPVPGSTGATYAIELLPAASQSRFTQCSTTYPAESMLELNGSTTGSFRIKSTGFSGKAKASIVTTFKRPSFLDYVYFTQYETLDPITYANSSWLEDAYKQCEQTIQEGRYSSSIPHSSGTYCSVISFISDEQIKGPLHTNDALVVCGNPSFGRTSADSIEVSASYPGWYWGASSALGGARLDSRNCSSANPTFTGNYKYGQPTLSPPETNSELSKIAESGFKYTGQVRICLSGTSMTIGSGSSCTGVYSGSIPANGVIYVKNGSNCSATYSPSTVSYPSTSSCGTAYVQGSYSGQLTIAAENDIVVNGSLTRSGTGMLGLIANNFVRIYHPYPNETTSSCGSSYGEVRLADLTVEAAILAIKHSFIVDHYDCGNDLGTLTVKGAIAQKFRGPVGTFSGSTAVSGYSKNYEYDDRLRYQEPPYFLDPVTKSWVIGRETLG